MYSGRFLISLREKRNPSVRWAERSRLTPGQRSHTRAAISSLFSNARFRSTPQR